MNRSLARKKIRELGQIVTGKTPSTRSPGNFGGPYPFVTIPDLDGSVLIERTARSLSEEGARAIYSSLLPVGAVMMSCIATVGRVGITTRPSFTNQQINAVIPRDGVDSHYLYYAFRRLGGELQRMGAGGSVYTNVSKSRFGELEVPLPPIELQKKIAGDLGELDNKIELNRRMNETLEATARAIFKSWFVDFDPVRAKMEGRQPINMSAETAALFPASFARSDVGLIPKGWQVKRIGEMVRVVGGSTPSTREPAYWDGPTPFATPRDLSSLPSNILVHTARTLSEEGAAQISSGVLPAGTVLLSSRAPIGYLAIAGVPLAINQGFIAMVCETSLLNYYVLEWARFSMERIKGRAGGSTFPEISKRNFRPLPILVPRAEILGLYEQCVTPLCKRVAQNDRESALLAKLRDDLLVRLVLDRVAV